MSIANILSRRIRIGKKEISLLEAGLLLFTLIEFIFVAYCNLCRIPDTLDNDAAKLFTHGIEIWKSKTIFIPSWVNETMLELDTAMIFALPLFGLTGNLFLSYGLSNIITLLLFYWFLCQILKRMGQPGYIGIISCGIITIPLSFGQLLYFDMMFFAAGFYGVKVLLAFMFIWIITTKAEERNLLYYFILVLATVFMFVFSVSTGPYSLLCALIPVAACYIWLELGKMEKLTDIFSKWLISFNNLIIYVEVFASLSGIALSRLKNVGSKGSTMKILGYGEFTDNLLDILDSYLEFLGSATYTDVNMLSVEGISALFHYVFALILLAAFVAVIIGTVKILFKEKTFSYQQGVYLYVFMLFLVNLIVIMLIPIYGSGRYLLMGLIPAIPLGVISIDKLIKNMPGKAQSSLCYFALLAVLLIVAVTSNLKVMKNDCRPDMNSNLVKYDHVIEFLNQNPEKFVFMLDDEGMAETLRAYDYTSGREYLAYMIDEEKVTVHDYYANRTDASFFDQSNMLIVDDYMTDINNLPEYIRNTYEKVFDYQNIHVYKSEVNRMDGIAGPEGLNEALDYFYSKGYEISNGDFSSEDGSLLVTGNADEDYDVTSYRFACGENSINITLSYEANEDEGELGVFRLLDGNSGDVICEEAIMASATELVLDNIDVSTTNSIFVQIGIAEGKNISLKSIEYRK